MSGAERPPLPMRAADAVGGPADGRLLRPWQLLVEQYIAHDTQLRLRLGERSRTATTWIRSGR